MKRNASTSRFSRRALLRLMAGAGAGIGLGGLPGASLADSNTTRPVMRAIPRDDAVEIPAVGLGTARTFDVGARVDDADVLEPRREVLRAFHAEGGRLVDSSPMYGTAEELVGRLAEDLGITEELFMATKVWTDGEEAGIEQMERSMERLHTRPMDLMQVHNLRDLQTHLQTLYRWKEEGRVRYIGITHYRESAYDELIRLLEQEELDFVQFNYSIATRAAEERMLPTARDQGTATLINEPFEKGTLFQRVAEEPLPDWAAEFDCESWAQFFLKYVISHPAVTCVIPATSDPDHARDNTRAALGALPDERQRRRMVETVEKLA